MRVIDIKEFCNQCTEDDFKEPFVIPTETVYGLAAPLDNPDALKKIYKLKNRPTDNPLIVHVSSVEMLKTLIKGDIPEDYAVLIDGFWSGPLTLIFKAADTVPNIVRGKSLDTVGIRMPNCKYLRMLIERTGPLAAPSANISGRPSPTTVEHCIYDFGERVSLYFDGGPCAVGVESTVVGMEDGECVLLRAGVITPEDIEKTIGKKIKIATEEQPGKAVKSPGQKYKHYSPSVPVYVFLGDDWEKSMIKYIKKNKGKRIGLLSTIQEIKCEKKDSDENIMFFVVENSAENMCYNIFAGFRHLELCCDLIFVQGNWTGDYSLAIMDRLKKAATLIVGPGE